MSDQTPVIGIIMGSQSDWETMKNAADVLDALNVAYETKIVSAHRTPDRLYDYAKTAKSRGLKVIIAGAGGAAHLPGMAAAMTPFRFWCSFKAAHSRALIACFPSFRCRAAFRSEPLPLAQPGQRMPV